MPGLNLGLGGGVKLGSSLGGKGSSGPATIAQTAYGAENSPNSQSQNGVEPWHLMTAVPIAALAWLVFLRWSLPK
jgi:hypothetical protein